MAKVKVTTKWDLVKYQNDILKNSDKENLGLLVVDEIKSAMDRGQSPVRGQGRFQAYKEPKKYPGKRKQKRPVNLELTGALKNSITFKKTKNGIEVGSFNGPEYAEVHNKGSDIIPRRPFIPLDKEELNISIQRKIIGFMTDVIDRYLKKTNRG